VVHIHSAPIWQSAIHHWIVTPPETSYGTPEMAVALKNCCKSFYLQNPNQKVLKVVMAGHKDGLIFAATKMQAILNAIENELKR
jgi:hypothetical protein